MARSRPLPGTEGGAGRPGRYASLREYRQKETARISSLDDVVYDLLKKAELPVHREWLRRMAAREPVRVPVWALTDFDDGAPDLEWLHIKDADWLSDKDAWQGRQDDVLIWADDQVTKAPKLKPDEAYVDPAVFRSSWEKAGHTPRWPLD